MFRNTIIAAAAAIFATPVLAEDVNVQMSVFEEVFEIDENGTEVAKLVAPESVVPNDTVVYVVSMTNDGEETASRLSFNVPVPEEVIIDPSSIDAGPEASAVFATRQSPEVFGPLSELTVQGEDGLERPATASDIGVVRVGLADLEPSDDVRVQYAATVR
jgi:uncharacterized repeat protein (TIGR01451 family)